MSEETRLAIVTVAFVLLALAILLVTGIRAWGQDFPSNCFADTSIWVSADTCVEIQLRELSGDTTLRAIIEVQSLGLQVMDWKDQSVNGVAWIRFNTLKYDLLAKLRADRLGIKP
jgi:hypothetical protein